MGEIFLKKSEETELRDGDTDNLEGLISHIQINPLEKNLSSGTVSLLL